MTKNLCPYSALMCQKDCILYTPKGRYKKDSGEDYPAHCGKFGVRFEIEEVTG